MSGIVALGILAVFAVAAVLALLAANEQPLRADRVPKGQAALICVHKSEAGTTVMTPARPGKGGQARLVCPAGSTLAATPQARAAYNPHRSMKSVLVLVAPLLTTIVGFYFGARAGSGEGRATAARAKEREQGLLQRLKAEDSTLYAKLKKERRIR